MATDLAPNFRVLALTTQRDPFPRVNIKAERAQDVATMAIAHIYALHGLQVEREQLLVEHWPLIQPPACPPGGRRDGRSASMLAAILRFLSAIRSCVLRPLCAGMRAN